MKNTIDANELNEGLSVVKFGANWCGPCRMYAPIMENVSKTFNDVKFFSIDVDTNGELASAYGVSSIPMTAIVKDGKIVERFVGVRDIKSLTAMIQKHK
jgi:thioredoxin 1